MKIDVLNMDYLGARGQGISHGDYVEALKDRIINFGMKGVKSLQMGTRTDQDLEAVIEALDSIKGDYEDEIRDGQYNPDPHYKPDPEGEDHRAPYHIPTSYMTPSDEDLYPGTMGDEASAPR